MKDETSIQNTQQILSTEFHVKVMALILILNHTLGKPKTT